MSIPKDFNRKKYEKSLDWSKLKCKMHPEKKAVMQMNPPIGGFFCQECRRDMHIQRIRNMGVGF